MPATIMPGPDQVTPRRVRFEDGERGRLAGGGGGVNHIQQMIRMGQDSGELPPPLSVLSAQDLLFGGNPG